MTPIYLRGRRVMHVRNGVAVRHAKPSEMLAKPPAWAFHGEVLAQLEAANVCHLEVVCDGHVYRVPWVTFAALSAELDRGFGRQRFLPLQYFSIDGRPPQRRPHIAEPLPKQLELFA